MARLSGEQIEQIKFLLDKQGELPIEWRSILFPTEKQEYELIYAGKQREEDIIADAMAVPLQAVRSFCNGFDGWHNRLIFGDNLQAMKSMMDDSDIAGKVKLVYIDPPFATRKDFHGSEDQKAYQDKVIGSAFLEFVRSRLILIRELMHPQGTIYVHIDWKKGHYIKVLMDEVFGERRFRNDIAWYYYNRLPSGGNVFESKHDSLLVYTKSSEWTFHPQYEQRETTVKKKKQVKVGGRSMNARDESGNIVYLDLDTRKVDDVWLIPLLVRTAHEYTGYPTQKPEALLERIISASTDPDDIVLDAFAGSGTALAVAEKLGRRWIGIDCGKLAIYIIQKRMLNLRENIGNNGGKRIQAKPFTLYNAGLYDFSSLKELPWNAWRFFALQLFECKDKPQTIGGLALDGERRGAPVLVFNWKQHPGEHISEETIDDIHAAVGQKIGRRFYIIAPMLAFDFQQDYIVRDNVRYYALRIPYSFIHELHQKDFQAVLQARDANEVNDVQEAYGFSFMVSPEVEFQCGLQEYPSRLFPYVTITTKEFISRGKIKGTERRGDKETLALLLIDLNYDGEVFELDRAYFGDELEAKDWVVKFDPTEVGEKVMAVWIDHYGNEFKAVIKRTDFGLAPVEESRQDETQIENKSMEEQEGVLDKLEGELEIDGQEQQEDFTAGLF